MQKKLGLSIGFLILALLLTAWFLRPAEERPVVRPVSAGQMISSFTNPINISNSPSEPGGDENGSQKVRAILGDEAYLHVAWMEGTLNKRNGPAYVRGQGTAWPQWQYAGPSNNPGYTNPTLAQTSDGTVHLVWSGGGGSPYKIFYASKPPGGSWSAYTVLSKTPNNTSFYPSIVADSDDRLWVVWETQITEQDFEVYVTTKPAGGSWSNPLIISNKSGQDLEPSIAIDPDDVPHVVWRNGPGNWEIYYTKYVNGDWTTPMNISANASGSHFARVAADDLGNVYVVWEDEIDGADRFQILFRRWDGTSWGGQRRISATPTKALWPAISVDHCNLYVVWTDFRNTSTETYFSYSTNCGDTWSADENVSNNTSSSYFPDVAAQGGGYAHIFWQDYISGSPGNFDIYYSKGTIEVPSTPTPIPTTAIPTTAIPTITPTPTPYVPYGWVEIRARQPYSHTQYTRLLSVALHFSATSPLGNLLEMRYANQADMGDNWKPYKSWVDEWDLGNPGANCEHKWVFAQFRDAENGYKSPMYSDYIFYDGDVQADMDLNDDKIYTSQPIVMVGTSDVDLDSGCTGLKDMIVWEEALTQTVWISYFPRLYFFLNPLPDPPTRTVYTRYRDYAGNEGVFSDTIILDTNPPHDGAAPLLAGGAYSTTHLLISVSGMEAQDDESGIARIWLANRDQGPWQTRSYCADPPCSYSDWCLGYGGPPIQDPETPHRVYVRYEDRSGYGPFPGNLSEIVSGEIFVQGISNAYLPIVLRRHTKTAGGAGQGEGGQVKLYLLSEPQQAGPGEEILLWLAAQRSRDPAVEGTLHLHLPPGVQVLQAWSAYGQLLWQDAHLVISQERASPRKVPWILVRARIEEHAPSGIEVTGEMSWTEGTEKATPLQIGSP